MKQNPELSKQSYLRLTCRSGLRDKAEENWGRERIVLQLWFHVLPTQAADDAKETAGGLARVFTETSSSATMSGFAAIVVFSSPPSALLWERNVTMLWVALLHCWWLEWELLFISDFLNLPELGSRKRRCFTCKIINFHLSTLSEKIQSNQTVSYILSSLWNPKY